MDTQLTLREFWKDHFNILHCVTLLDGTWSEVSYKTMNSAWKKLWPEAVIPRDFEGFEDGAVSMVNDTVSLGKSIGLKVDADDVEELEDQNTEGTTEELSDLQTEQQH